MPPQARIRLPTLALKPKGDIIRSPKQGYQWPHKKDPCPLKFKKKKFCMNTIIVNYVKSQSSYYVCVTHS